MTGTQSLISRAALGSAVALVCAAAISSRKLLAASRRSFDIMVIGSMMVSRLGLYSLIFLLLRIPARGDIPGAYTIEGLAALSGQLVYRDYLSSYAPLHSYLDAAFFRLWPSPVVLILFAVLVEQVVLPIWLRTARRFMPEQDVRMAALLYLVSPISVQFVTVDGQDNVVIAALLALAVMLLIKSREVLSGACMAISIVTFKFLPLMYVPGFWLAAGRRRWYWVAGWLVPTGLVYGAFVLMHSPILVPLQREGAMRKASCLPFIVETLTGRFLPLRLWDIVTVLGLGLVLMMMARAMHGADAPTSLRVLTFSMAALTWTLLLLSKKSWTPYLMLCLFPVCLVLAGSVAWKRYVFLLFSVVAVVERSFWTIRLGEMDAESLHVAVFAGNHAAMEFFSLEVLLVAGYIWLLVETLRHMMAPPRGATEAEFTGVAERAGQSVVA